MLMARLFGRSIAAFLLAMAIIPAAAAQNPPPVVNAVVGVEPPFVIQDGDRITGFSIDLWNAVAAKLGVQTNYQIVPDVAAEYQAMLSKKADVVVAPAVYTKQLDEEFDFSHPVLNAGFLVTVLDRGGMAAPNPLLDLVHLIFSQALLVWLGIGLVLILIPAHMFWLLDRGSEDRISPDKRYFPGIFHAMLWTSTALVSQVQFLPRQRIARVLAIVWMFVGVVFIAVYTAQITATLTVQQFHGAINGPEDLPGKRVAALAGSHAVFHLRELKAVVREYPSLDEVFGALLAGKVDAAFTNGPIARYYVTHEGMGKVRTVGDEYHREDFGFLLQLESPLRRRVDDASIDLHESGTYDQLFNKWFGGS